MFEMERKIPHTMSTQHPDNARSPSWCANSVVSGEDEVTEACFAYSEMGCEEVMWDSEGKDVDTRVIRKMLSKSPDYFEENVIGRDIFLTYRLPNPRTEVSERKVVLETLFNIPVAADVASSFYGREVEPIFEVILPFTTCAEDLTRLHDCYVKGVSGFADIPLNGSSTIADWVGSIRPRDIQVIPLVEDMDSLLKIDRIVAPYLDAVRPPYLRVFLARSDPALNYGMFGAVILSKISISKLSTLAEERRIEMHPIIGAGSMPFRGHLSPENVSRFLEEYPGISTVTIQSAFKYDYDLTQVRRAIRTLNRRLPTEDPQTLSRDEETALESVVKKLMAGYQSTVEKLAPLINSVARYVPPRRARKLHIGLFGYSRTVRGIALPRAIPFAAALYSIGLPPEFIGARVLSDLSEDEWELLKKCYANMKHDLTHVSQYLSWRNLQMIGDMHSEVARRACMSDQDLECALGQLSVDLGVVEKNLGVKLGPRNLAQRKYENILCNFLIAYIEREDQEAEANLVRAAVLRKCLG